MHNKARQSTRMLLKLEIETKCEFVLTVQQHDENHIMISKAFASFIQCNSSIEMCEIT